MWVWMICVPGDIVLAAVSNSAVCPGSHFMVVLPTLGYCVWHLIPMSHIMISSGMGELMRIFNYIIFNYYKNLNTFDLYGSC